VHGAVILGSVGLIGFGLVGVASGGHTPFGRFPDALALGIGTAIVGTLLILRIHGEAPSTSCCLRGFEEPWVKTLLAFNVAFLAALFLVQAWRASRSSGGDQEDDPFADWLVGGSPF
jgi:hypothetical protein